MADSDPIEEWRAIEGFPSYSVSDLGRVRRDTPAAGTRAGRILKMFKTRDGYLRATIYNENGPRAFSVHRLVALTFIGPPPPDKPEIDHLNCAKTDNRPENLEWVSMPENMRRAAANGLMASGERAFATRHPERMARGDRHGSKTKPWAVARGDRHSSRTHPELVVHGERVNTAKLTAADIPIIRARVAAGETLTSVAKDYPVTFSAIAAVATRRSWAHVP